MQFEENNNDSELCLIAGFLQKAIQLRKKYMRVSLQNNKWMNHVSPVPLNVQLSENGCVLDNAEIKIPSISEFYADVEYISKIIQYGPLRSFCYQRLEHLELRFRMHQNECASQEKKEQKITSSKDIYTVVKVDTHIHHSASMNSKKLLQFIKRKLREYPEEVVYHEDTPITLRDVFQKINKTPETLCLDSLDTHSTIDIFHRFDRFNSKYNPYGVPLLREIFLKHDNYIEGRYLAEITKELIAEVEEKEFLKCEWGISIYGKRKEEIEKLSIWIERYGIKSNSIQWFIQIPRLYGLFRGYNHVESFSEFLMNIFGPIISSSLSDKEDSISNFLQKVSGFDSVDDESVKARKYNMDTSPESWKHKDNPCYSYYMYYAYYYLTIINQIRASRGKNIFILRPHSGESGDAEHLIATFLLGKGIAHGIKLRKSPVLQYLYYLLQIGIAMSPLSNNSLFLEYKKNPFPRFFFHGLNVSLSTDDPLQFHFTKEPLMEEYSIASQIWRLSSCDQCEIARNSVLISNFPKKEKEEWIGVFDSPDGLVNHPAKTNIPPIRETYRKKCLADEYTLLKNYLC
ncbi:AMP deaminase [Nematocida sp. LUAm3]|nr:AMP deaminase [Nematocida sp. LUAm3]KAI5173601.1 AMP deaminase [Nematocida sp. LUAm2]KAI5176822.1 AMP deaminase [Nematocida sp. LUAm1]